MIQNISYKPNEITYKMFDGAAAEVLRITAKPKSVAVNGKTISELKSLDGDGWVWEPLDKGGVLRIRHSAGSQLVISK